MRLLLKVSWTKLKEMLGLYKLNSSQMWPARVHGEHNYPEEFAISATIQEVVEWDQVLPTQERSSIQGTGRRGGKKIQEGFMRGDTFNN